jgi:radical SAM superfamily enzyme YgiQ (UPF0313 family)
MSDDTAVAETLDLAAPAAGRPLRVVLLGFYNYESHALRILHPLLRRRGHEVHSVFFKNYFTYQVPTPQEEDMVVDLVARLRPDVVGMSVWSTYYRLAARLTDRIKAAGRPVVIWGGIHPQTRPEECLTHCDVVARGEGEYVMAELTDRVGLGRDWRDLRGTWARADDGAVIRNPPRLLIPDIDVLPPPDLSPENKYYLGTNAWRDVARWDRAAIAYGIMMVRGCPFECTFCIHNFTRTAWKGLGTYVRRRSIDHVMAELRAAVAERPNLRVLSIDDDIFAPSLPWLEEFCARYKREIGLPFVMYSFPRMVDEKRVKIMRAAGLWLTTMGIQSGSERIRRDCYERETSNEEIIEACRIFERHGVMTNLDFIGDNPYEDESDREATVDLLCRLPKPFYFNYFSLTWFPGVDLTERALRDGHIRPEDVEDVAQKGYHLWGASLTASRTPEQLRWDIAYSLAVHGVPKAVVLGLTRSRLFRRNPPSFIRPTLAVQAFARRQLDRTLARTGRPNLLRMYDENTNRDRHVDMTVMHPNFDSSPFTAPMATLERASS